MNIQNVAKRGASLATPHGISSEFYPRMFVTSRQDWIAQMNGLRIESDDLFDICYPDAYDGGNTGPVGEIIIEKHDGFVYVYIINSVGDFDSRFFTHEVIAGEYAKVPPFGGFFHSAEAFYF